MPSSGHPSAPADQMGVSRRALAKGAAWALPSIAVAGAAPAFADSTCPELIAVPWSRLWDGTKAEFGGNNTYIAYVMYPTSDRSGSQSYDWTSPVSTTGTAGGGVDAGNMQSYPPDFTNCSGDCSVVGKTVQVTLEQISGDTQYSPDPITYTRDSANDDNPWPYMVTQRPDDNGITGQGWYEVTTYSAHAPQAWSLPTEYTGVAGTSSSGNPTWYWEYTMVKNICSPSDGDNAVEYQIFIPPHFVNGRQEMRRQYRVTTTSPWGTNVYTTKPV